METRAPDSGGSFFIPFLTGYVVASALRSFTSYDDDYFDYRRRNRYYPTPIYRNRAGQTLTTTVTGTDRTPRPFNVNTRTASRQGFGGRSSSRGFSFGG